ncbi:peptide/nickel transport system permease protein [Caldanaerobius fijiensis DSM 17918]|uniref:Peptide/nickel transport system permease protein n=1 Tax=Caldanaerobius fijiensis DSM 17918 TaxID=1121256 RepID=A0A1M4XVQ9_9THEO|nr:ABC transporter permease [Caldanaerobius fijiensis]SHE97436.1 peptide/nickel transport system permease protein [Caldanaerobius fijiensis DSM 17918]
MASIVNIWIVLKKNKRAFIGMIILLIFLFLALVGPYIIPPATQTNYAERLQLPSFKHPLGTDYAGRDTLSQFVHGSRNVLLVAFLAAFFTLIIAFIIGTISGTLGGTVDAVLMLITNVVLTVPSFPIMMVLSMVAKISDPITFGLLLSIWSWAGLARAIRSQILSLKNRDFIEASKILDMGLIHIIFKEMLPNMVSYIAINFIMMMRGAITASVGLMVLGLVPFQASHWGMMLNMAVTTTGAIYGSSAIIYFLVPVLAIMFFQMGCLFFANGLDEALNPRLRGR